MKSGVSDHFSILAFGNPTHFDAKPCNYLPGHKQHFTGITIPRKSRSVMTKSCLQVL